MTIFQSRARVPGFPTCSDSINGTQYVGTYSDQWMLILKPEHESMLGEDILNALPTDYQLGGYLGSFARLQQRALKRDKEARLKYLLDLSYTTNFEEEGGITGGSLPPDQRTAKWSWDFEQYSAVLRRDVDNGNPVINSVGEPFEITTDFALPILTVERYQAFFDPDAVINYVNHRNNGNFWGASGGMVVCVGIRDREGETYQSLTYRLVTYTFKFFVPFIQNVIEGATEIVLNAGNRYRPSVGAAPIDARTIVNLADNGTKLAIESTPIYKRFQKHPLANFDDLGVNIHQI